jgi:2',3'-cyclic-nucleotide 2'-phosphodiesterase (5'-nucleotidase family)
MDAGDFMGRIAGRDAAKNELVWSEFNRQGYDAVTIGEIELRQWEVLKRLIDEIPIPLVCTNLEWLRDTHWVPLGEKYRIIDADGVKVGVLAVISETLVSSHVVRSTNEEIRVLPPLEEIERLLPTLAEQTDIIVLLSHMEAEPFEQFASLLSGVDVILGGHVTGGDEAPVQIVEAIVNRSGTRGQKLASTRMIISPHGEIVDFGGANVTLLPEYPEDPAVLEMIAQANRLSKQAREEQQRARQRDTSTGR